MPYPRGQQFLQGVQQMRVLSRLSQTDELPCRYSLFSQLSCCSCSRCSSLCRHPRVERDGVFGPSTALWADAFVAWM